jgi:hypothetical protein
MLQQVPPRLATLSDAQVSHQLGADEWSAKQELGHLLDSAIVNHNRLMRVLTEDNPTLASYDGVFWVTAHNYRDRNWQDLIETWVLLNTHLLMVAEGVGDEGWQRSCVIDGKSATLEFLITDYVHHALHHLKHIGIEMRDLLAANAAA